jgi:hypothetical protein
VLWMILWYRCAPLWNCQLLSGQLLLFMADLCPGNIGDLGVGSGHLNVVFSFVYWWLLVVLVLEVATLTHSGFCIELIVLSCSWCNMMWEVASNSCVLEQRICGELVACLSVVSQRCRVVCDQPDCDQSVTSPWQVCNLSVMNLGPVCDQSMASLWAAGDNFVTSLLFRLLVAVCWDSKLICCASIPFREKAR